jgi:hypothetical protein
MDSYVNLRLSFFVPPAAIKGVIGTATKARSEL